MGFSHQVTLYQLLYCRLDFWIFGSQGTRASGLNNNDNNSNNTRVRSLNVESPVQSVVRHCRGGRKENRDQRRSGNRKREGTSSRLAPLCLFHLSEQVVYALLLLDITFATRLSGLFFSSYFSFMFSVSCPYGFTNQCNAIYARQARLPFDPPNAHTRTNIDPYAYVQIFRYFREEMSRRDVDTSTTRAFYFCDEKAAVGTRSRYLSRRCLMQSL